MATERVRGRKRKGWRYQLLPVISVMMGFVIGPPLFLLRFWNDPVIMLFFALIVLCVGGVIIRDARRGYSSKLSLWLGLLGMFAALIQACIIA